MYDWGEAGVSQSPDKLKTFNELIFIGKYKKFCSSWKKKKKAGRNLVCLVQFTQVQAHEK